jgi:uncharacterized protein YoxC
MNTATLELPPSFYVFLGMAILVMLVNAVMFGAMAFAAFKLAATVKTLEPKLSRLADQVNDDIVPKVHTLVMRVDSISERVSGMTDSANNAVRTLSSGVGSASNAIGGLVDTGARSVEKLAPLLGYMMLAVKFFQTVSALRTAVAKPETEPKKTKRAKAANIETTDA